MYKIVPAERQGRLKETITKNRCKPSKNGLQRSFLAPPARLELTTFRLGGGPSILVRYGGVYRKHSILQGSGIRTVRLLGGGRSILLSYQGVENGFPVRRGNFPGGQPLFYPIPAALSTAHKKIAEKSSLSAILLLRSVLSHVIMCICV